MRLIDIGVNLGDKSFNPDRQDVIDNAKAQQVAAQVITGTDLSSSLNAVNLCQTDPDYLYSTAGFHPHHAKDYRPEDHATLKRLLLQEDCVKAVGECGLDFNRNFSPPEVQCAVFETHLELAVETQLPLFMHERDAHAQFSKIFRGYQNEISRGVVHCFTGNRQALEDYLEMGLYIGITGWICDERRGKELLALLPEIPLDRLMIETDAPYLLPRDLDRSIKPKSRRNEPRFLPHIAATIAKVLNLELDTVAEHTFQNSRRFFDLPNS